MLCTRMIASCHIGRSSVVTGRLQCTMTIVSLTRSIKPSSTLMPNLVSPLTTVENALGRSLTVTQLTKR
jgi:dihydroorotase